MRRALHHRVRFTISKPASPPSPRGGRRSAPGDTGEGDKMCLPVPASVAHPELQTQGVEVWRLRATAREGTTHNKPSWVGISSEWFPAFPRK